MEGYIVWQFIPNGTHLASDDPGFDPICHQATGWDMDGVIDNRPLLERRGFPEGCIAARDISSPANPWEWHSLYSVPEHLRSYVDFGSTEVEIS